jgi:hypothetical protein
MRRRFGRKRGSSTLPNYNDGDSRLLNVAPP